MKIQISRHDFCRKFESRFEKLNKKQCESDTNLFIKFSFLEYFISQPVRFLNISREINYNT